MRKLVPRLSILLAACVVVLAGCRGSSPPASKSLVVHINIPGKPDSIPPAGGIVIDVDASLSTDYRRVSVTGSDGKSRDETTLGGEYFDVVGNILHYGPRRYGPLKEGDRVVLDKEGVLVNGVRVQPLP